MLRQNLLLIITSLQLIMLGFSDSPLSTEIVVTGIGLLSCLGTREQTWLRLLQGESGITISQPFPELRAFPLGLVGKEPILLDELIEPIIKEALVDAQLEPPLVDCGIVIGSSRGFQGNWEQLAQFRQQELLARSLDLLPHQVALKVAHYVNTIGVVLMPMSACATGIWAIFQGFELIRRGQCQRVIVGALEAPITRLSLIGFEKMGALAKNGCYPFSKHREGLVLAEGGAILVLESLELARQRGASIYGYIRGFGLTCDAHHISAPESTHHSAIAAINQCLQRSHFQAEQIDYIHAHGTSTLLNDQAEADMMTQIFPPSVFVSSTKGATGHALGASGVLGAAFCLMALKNQILPPCIGLKEPEFNLNFVTKAVSSEINRSLCFSFGFGGQNAIMALSRT